MASDDAVEGAVPLDFDLQAALKHAGDDATYRRRVLDPPHLALPRIPESSVRWESKDRYDLKDFLGLHDTELVTRAYHALLKREPDAAGQARFVQGLRSGELSKTEVVGSIRYSPEGQAVGVPVDGLRGPSRWAAIGRMPVLGYLVRFALALMRLPHLVRSHQRVEATFNAAMAHLEATAAAERKRQTFTMRLVADEFAARAKAESLSLERITASVASLAAEVGRSADTAREHRQQLSQFAERVGDLQRTLDEEIAERKARERSASLDSQFYVALEDHFRGTREEIKRRVAEHLPLIRAALGGDMDATVLDVGCGRGEWIEVLLENGLSARGVDSGTAMVEACTRRGFVVSQADALEHLQSLPAESLGAITAFHLIEHLPFPQLSALIREMHRVLRPGGLILLETPNPENLIVGACNFWYDPTHLKPLPPELMMFLCSACGFSDVDIQRLHPFPPERHLSGCDRQVVGRLNELMYGWQDYAVVGRKR